MASASGYSESEIRACDELANVWTRRGIALLNQDSPSDLKAAIDCFDRAISIRDSLPLEQYPGLRYGLAAGWLNRGDALTRLGSTAELNDAVRSFDEGVRHLNALPLDENPLYRQRLAVAWLNRGLAFQAQSTELSRAEALRCFDRCIGVLNDGNFNQVADRAVLLACAYMNRGNALLAFAEPDADAALIAARQALPLIAAVEEEHLVAAEAGFKARHVLCRAVALLARRDATAVQSPDWIAAATDAVDDGMKLARHWESRGVQQFRFLAAELFHFGARVYQACQPQFLSEFLLESLDPALSAGALADCFHMHAAACDALQRTLGELQRDGFKLVNTPHFAEWMEQLRQVRLTHERLAELRRGL